MAIVRGKFVFNSHSYEYREPATGGDSFCPYAVVDAFEIQRADVHYIGEPTPVIWLCLSDRYVPGAERDYAAWFRIPDLLYRLFPNGDRSREVWWWVEIPCDAEVK